MGLRGRNQFLDEECFFVTTTCYNWYHLLQMEVCKLTISESINFLNNKYTAATLGYVIMPNHIHLILYYLQCRQVFRPDDSNFTILAQWHFVGEINSWMKNVSSLPPLVTIGTTFYKWKSVN